MIASQKADTSVVKKKAGTHYHITYTNPRSEDHLQ